MAQHVGRLCIPATLISIIFILLSLSSVISISSSTEENSILPTIKSIKSLNGNNLNLESESAGEVVVNPSDYGVLVEVAGANLDKIDSLNWSREKDKCEKVSNNLELIWRSKTSDKSIYGLLENNKFEVTTVYFCLRSINGPKSQWIHVGNGLSFETKNRRSQRETNLGNLEVRINGLRLDGYDKEAQLGSGNGIPDILAGQKTVIRVFGTGLTNQTRIAFTDESAKRNSACIRLKSDTFIVKNADMYTGTVEVELPLLDSQDTAFYICVGDELTNDSFNFKHQGTESYNTIRTHKKFLAFWLQVLIIVVCLSFSALFSGLNLGLMSMDRTELKILCNTGTEREKAYAKIIQPVRDHGNYLLCSILFSNVLVNSIFTILLDDLTSGEVAIVCSTLLIVIFGEISPQAFCSRHGLCVGAKTIYITKFTMCVTYPLSYPISKFLDLMLGEEIGNVYNRERLKELVKVTTGFNDLEKDEVNIISGALELRKKTVADVMTKIEDVYMLDYNAILDFETVSDIMKSGYSRIPVFEGIRNNIITMLYIKDLAFVDPDDNTPLRTLCQFYQNPCNFVFEDVTLDIMFKQFKEGHKGHMAFVQRVNNEGEGDPFYEVIGLVTLEDVIEELIQAEIMDETDVFTDNRNKRKRLNNRPKMPDFTLFAEKKENHRIHISPQLTLAMFQYLSTTVDSFKPETISETILRRLLKQDIIHHIKVKSREKARNDPTAVIYQQGMPVDYFVLILEGRVEVTVGKENLMFESGPFTYFGCQALSANIVIAESPTNVNPQTLGSIQSINLDAILRHTFVPDYSVRAVTEVFYVKIKRSLYLAAKRASLLERSQKDPSPSQDQFDDEVEKLLHSLDEDDRSLPTSPIAERIKEIERNDLQQQQQQQLAIRNASELASSLPVSASPNTNSTFVSTRSGHNGQLKNSPVKIQEVSSADETQVKLDVDSEIGIRQGEEVRYLPSKKITAEDEEKADLLSKQDRS